MKIGRFKGVLLFALVIVSLVLYSSSITHAQENAVFSVSPGAFTVSDVPLTGTPYVIPQKLIVWNRDNVDRAVFISSEIPPENAVSPGYNPIPNENWVILSPYSILIPENSFAEIQISLDIPRWDNLTGKKWEVWIPVERQPLPGEVRILRPTVRIKIETTELPPAQPIFSVSPGEFTASQVPVGIPYTASQNIVVWNRDNIERVVSITSEIPPENSVTPGYEPIPNENWVIPSPASILIKENSYAEVQISLNIPRWENLTGKKWEVWIPVERQPLPGEVGILRPTVRIKIETTEENVKTSTALSVSPSIFTLYPDENKTLVAMLRDANNNALANKTIIWNTTAGSLSASSSTTNSSGWTLVTYTAPQVTAQTSVTVTAYFMGDNQYQASYGSSAGTVLSQPVAQSTSLSIFPSCFALFPGYSGQVQSLIATLRDGNNNPLPNKTITWSAALVSVNPSSGTTDASGQVFVVYTAPTVTAGTSVTITASFAGDSQYRSSSATSSGIPATQVSENISASAGGTVVINVIGTNVTVNVLVVPPNALRENTTINIVQKPPENLPTYAMVSPISEIGPSETTFATPSTLTLPYDENKIPSGASEDNLAIYRRTSAGGSWELVGGNVNKAANTISVQIDHLSEYAVMASVSTVGVGGGELPLLTIGVIIAAISIIAVIALLIKRR